MKPAIVVIAIAIQAVVFTMNVNAIDIDQNANRAFEAVAECKNEEAANPNQATLKETKSAICFKGRVGRDTDKAIIPLLSRKDKIFVVNSIG